MSIRSAFLSPSRRPDSGFSLVEVTIAIGIFAFVIVAILGLFPAALKQRTAAALETRGMFVAQQIFESISSATTTNAIPLPPTGSSNNLTFKSLGSFPQTLQFDRIGTSPLLSVDGDAGWSNGVTDADADSLALVRIEAVGSLPGLYRATVDYGRPASLRESQRQNFSFTKFFYLP
jgi:uncharacterized protein (TIGR02598 family)